MNKNSYRPYIDIGGEKIPRYPHLGMVIFFAAVAAIIIQAPTTFIFCAIVVVWIAYAAPDYPSASLKGELIVNRKPCQDPAEETRHNPRSLLGFVIVGVIAASMASIVVFDWVPFVHQDNKPPVQNQQKPAASKKVPPKSRGLLRTAPKARSDQE